MDDIPLLDFSLKKHRDLLHEKIESKRGIHSVEIRKIRNQKSVSQNAYLFGVVYKTICPTLTELEGSEVDLLTAHEFFKERFARKAIINKENGEMLGGYTRSTRDFDMAEMSTFIQKVIKFAYDKLNIVVPPATDYGTRERGTAA